MSDEYQDLVAKTVGERFAYCGLEHPLLVMLHQKAVAGLLASRNKAENDYDACSHIDSVPLPPLPSAAALDPVQPVDPMELIKKDSQLPPLPAVLYELQRVIQDEVSDAETVAKVVRSDAGLSTFLLRLVNSAFYSFPARIDTVTRAVTMVGTRPLYLLSMGMVFQDLVNSVPRDSLDIANFWRHSIVVGLASQEIWREMGYHESERLFTAGLLHDVGKLALACLLPASEQFYRHLTILCREKPVFEVERELLGFDHSRFGGMLLRKWNMPASLAMPVLWHHQPQSAAHYKEPMVVHLADLAVTAMGISVIPGSVVPRLDVAAWESVGLGLEKFDEIIDSVLVRLHDVCALFGVQTKK